MQKHKGALKLPCDKISIFPVEMEDGEGMLDFFYREIGCEMVQTVRPQHLPQPFVMVVDEEGLCKDKPMLNAIGSWLYGTHEHGQPIVGNVLIVSEETDCFGETDFAVLTQQEMNIVINFIYANIETILNDMREYARRCG